MAKVLNLNNEVVKMRKEVKKVRALVIRKLTRQISGLRRKKGTESEMEKNQRKVTRLMEEIKQMKTLKPDYVTKEALQKNLSFEKVCKDPECTLLDRATARIASHPQISKHIEELKASVNAFNEERGKTQSSGKPVKNTGEDIIKPKNLTTRENDKANLSDIVTQGQDLTEKPADNVRDETSSQVQSTSCLDSRKTSTQMEGNSSAKQRNTEISTTARISQTVPKKGVLVKTQLTPKNTSISAVEAMKEVESEEDEDSEVEPSDKEEEKEYFDDSTEERFHLQSSESEDSDDDDFFLGKVSKYKKKKKMQSSPVELVSYLKNPFSSAVDLVAETGGADRVEGKGKQGCKPPRLETMFCNSLSGLRQASMRGNRKLMPSTKQQDNRLQQGRGRGRPQFEKPQGRTAPGGKGPGSQNTQQTLHPSWEASKRRKEQQAQIMAFQGKKIKFDD
ncbi:serum response factor-binding protein 1 isoform X2 [Arapaima gigas]